MFLYFSAEVLLITRRSSIFCRLFSIASINPLMIYTLEASSLSFLKGNTTIDFLDIVWSNEVSTWSGFTNSDEVNKRYPTNMPASMNIIHLMIFHFPFIIDPFSSSFEGIFDLPLICSFSGTINPGLAIANTSIALLTFLNSNSPNETAWIPA